MPKVVVVGSINMDVTARTARHPAVGETVLGSDLRFTPGGKGANQAVASARFGAATTMVGRIGSDVFGASLLEFLGGEEIDVTGVVGCDAASGTALIVVDDDGNNSIVVVPGANATMTPADLMSLALESGDVVLAQLEIPIPVVGAAFSMARAAGARTILNPAPADPAARELFELSDLVVMNEIERAALGPAGDGTLIVTLGEHGAVAYVGADVIRVEGRRVTAVDSTGAGDCFVGVLAAGLCAGESIEAAVTDANLAASISVQRVGAGTSMPTRAEVARQA